MLSGNKANKIAHLLDTHEMHGSVLFVHVLQTADQQNYQKIVRNEESM